MFDVEEEIKKLSSTDKSIVKKAYYAIWNYAAKSRFDNIVANKIPMNVLERNQLAKLFIQYNDGSVKLNPSDELMKLVGIYEESFAQ